MKKIVSLLLVLILCLSLCACGSEQPDIDALTKAYLHASWGDTVEPMLNLLPPQVIEKIKENIAKNDSSRSFEEYIEMMNFMAKMMNDAIEEKYGTIERAYEIISAEECSKSEIEQLKDAYFDIGAYIDIENAVQVIAKITVTASGTLVETSNVKITFVQVDGQWYTDLSSTSFSA